MSRGVGLAGVLALLLVGCVPLPLKVAGSIEGRVVDAVSGQPVEGALVVIRFDGVYDEVLPESVPLGHREAISDSWGRFHAGPVIAPGFMAWPWLRTRAQVATVLREGYRCAAERLLPAQGETLRIPLQRALDRNEQQESCRPVAAAASEIPQYTKAWKDLHPMVIPDPGPTLAEKEVDRALAARAALGFGPNCHGPVEDLALDPSGQWVAFSVRDGKRVEIWVSGSALADAQLVALGSDSPPRTLTWTGAGELALRDRLERLERVWTPVAVSEAPPASQAPEDAGAPLPFEPADHYDETATRWMGRAFVSLRELDPVTGLPRDLLRVTGPGDRSQTLALPGEACTQDGRFGRPHYRVSEDGRFGFDIRFVDGGCRAVAIELATGAWHRLDSTDVAASCERTRRIPASHLGTALRGYLQEIEASLTRAELDPASAFSLRIAASGDTRIETHDALGARRVLPAPRFPVTTPLRRIDVSVVGNPMQGTAAPAQLEPL